MSKFTGVSALFKHWCYQFIALKEQRAGLFHDAELNRAVAHAHSDVVQQLLARASGLAVKQEVAEQFEQVRRIGVSTASVLLVIIFFLGLSAGLAALGSPGQAVNVIWSLLGLLLMPTVTLLLWLVSLSLPVSGQPWLGHLLQRLMNRILGKSRLADAWYAWIELARQARALPWWLALGSHLMWCGLLLGSLLAMGAAFSLRHYTFVWETTWLPVDVFVSIASGIGRLSGWLGLPMPDATAIAASGNQALDDPAVRLRWANWLIGSILMIGLVPRVLAVLVCMGALWRRYSAYRIATDSAYASAVLAQIRQDCPVQQVDGPPGPADQWHLQPPAHGSFSHGQPVAVVGLDLSAMPDWAQSLPGSTVLDDRDSRQRILQQFDAKPPQRLLIIVDAGQTPDRGSVSVLHSLRAKAQQIRVYLQPRIAGPDRSELWLRTLRDGDMAAALTTVEQAQQWLRGEQA